MTRALVGLAAIVIAWQSQELPAAYPRAGATSLLENEHVIVWDIAWLEQEYPFHRHRYDHVGVYYSPGDRIITSLEGEQRPVSTPAWNISFQLAGVAHAEAGASEEPLRAVFVQIKRAPRDAPAAPRARPAFPVDTPAQRLDNDRTSVWDYEEPGAGGLHTHVHDAVVVSFDADGRPAVAWIDRGTIHETDQVPGARRTLVFEIK